MSQRKFCTKIPQPASAWFGNRYSKEENAKILASVNGLSMPELAKFVSKARAQRIKKFQTDRGTITHLDQILTLDGFGIKVLGKVYCY